MRAIRVLIPVVLLLGIAFDAGSQPPGGQTAGGQPPAGQRPPATPPGGGQQRRAIQAMTLTSTAWPDGGVIPAKYSQAGEEVSPPLTWADVPENTASFVLIAHDLDAAVGNGTDDVLHWLVWNIPGASRSLPEGVPQGNQLADGTRQISVSGPYYRGPGAPAAGPPHHYVFELYALDSPLDIPAVGQSPALTRSAVVAAMAGRIRGKAAYVGLFKRTAAF